MNDMNMARPEVATVKIEKVEAAHVRIPLDVETSFAKRSVQHRDYMLVRVTDDQGQSGIGFCYCGHTAGEVVAASVRSLLAPVVIGEDPFRTEGIWERMYREGLLHGRAGSVIRAISAIDIALWDRNARCVGLPLHRFLGAHARDSVPAYASGGYYLDGKTPEMLGEELSSYVSLGFKAVKMKVGRQDLATERARIAAAREAIGPDIMLMLDANNAWDDLPTALQYMRIFEEYNPYWIEEPFSPDDIDNHVRLADSTPVPVATGEMEYGRWRHQELLSRAKSIILQTDAAVCGGITEFRRIAAMAAGTGTVVCPHWFHDLHVHLVAAIPNGPFVEFFSDDQVLNFRRLVTKQLEIRPDGTLALPTAPGLGFDFDEDVVQSYAIDGWR